MGLKVESVRLDDETLAKISRMTETIDRPRDWLIVEAIKQYVAHEEWFLLEVEKGVKAAEEGRFTDHKDIRAKWEAKDAVQMD